MAEVRRSKYCECLFERAGEYDKWTVRSMCSREPWPSTVGCCLLLVEERNGETLQFTNEDILNGSDPADVLALELEETFGAE